MHTARESHQVASGVGAAGSRTQAQRPWLGQRVRPRWLRLQLIAWWQAASLDRQLAAGADPQTSAVLAPRAQKLVARRSRNRVADALARALGSARSTTPGFTAAVRPQAREMLQAGAVLAALDRRLRCPNPIAAQGIATLAALLTDASSPLYQPSEPGTLASRLRAAAAALEPTEPHD